MLFSVRLNLARLYTPINAFKSMFLSSPGGSLLASPRLFVQPFKKRIVGVSPLRFPAKFTYLFWPVNLLRHKPDPAIVKPGMISLKVLSKHDPRHRYVSNSLSSTAVLSIPVALSMLRPCTSLLNTLLQHLYSTFHYSSEFPRFHLYPDVTRLFTVQLVQ